jgi:hypothetical protein
VAVNCWVCDGLIDGLEGVTAMDFRVAAVTVRESLGLTTLPSVAVIWAVPAATPVAKPVLAPMVATPVFEEAQVTEVVMFLVLLSL